MAEFNYHNYNIDNNGTYNQFINTHRYTRNDIRVAENEFAPTDPNTNSKVMLSTNVFIYSNGGIVGMIQSFTVNEQRQINKLQAIGWEGVVQAVPSNTRGGTLNVQRIALYDSTLFSSLGLTTNGTPWNALGRYVHDADSNAINTQNGWDVRTHSTDTEGRTISSGLVFRTLRDQRAPLEIMVRTPIKGTEQEYYTVTYIDCWLSSYSKPYGVGTITVSESATIAYGDVY